jgi:hypothetical protein
MSLDTVNAQKSALLLSSIQEDEEGEFQLDADSVRAVCKDSSQAMVYGFKSSKYEEIGFWLCKKHSPIKKLFDWTLGYKGTDASVITTLEGRKIHQFPYNRSDSPHKTIGRQCKAALTNLVWENYQRRRQGLPIIPLVFCIDNDDKPGDLDATLSTKDSNSVTLLELDRAFNLACLFEDEEIRAAAEATFKFVKVAKTGKNSYRLETIEAPWANKERRGKFEARALRSKQPRWSQELKETIRKFNQSTWSAIKETAASLYQRAWSCMPTLEMPHFALECG